MAVDPLAEILTLTVPLRTGLRFGKQGTDKQKISPEN